MNRYTEDTLLRIDGTVPLLDPVAMRLYLAIVRLADGPHGVCHEPITRIAARTGLDYTEALEARRRLSAAGLVTVRHEHHDDIVRWSYTPRVQQPAGADTPRLDAYIAPDLDDAGLSAKAIAVLAAIVLLDPAARAGWPPEWRDVRQLAEIRNERESVEVRRELDSLGLLTEDGTGTVFRNYPEALTRHEQPTTTHAPKRQPASRQKRQPARRQKPRREPTEPPHRTDSDPWPAGLLDQEGMKA